MEVWLVFMVADWNADIVVVALFVFVVSLFSRFVRGSLICLPSLNYRRCGWLIIFFLCGIELDESHMTDSHDSVDIVCFLSCLRIIYCVVDTFHRVCLSCVTAFCQRL